MNDDDLRAALSDTDPARTHEPVDRRRAAELLERIMATPVRTSPSAPPATAGARPRRTAWLAAAAAAVLVAGAGAGLALRDNHKGTPHKAAPTQLALSLPGGGGVSIGSCVPFNTAVLKDMSPAFRGTVVAVAAGSVTLDVDKWYAGGNADQVVLTQPGGTTSAALDGVEFEQGKVYLVTAANGAVNGCGYSGPVTADLQRAFDEAFGG